MLKLHRYDDVLDLVSRYNDLIQRQQQHTTLKNLRFDQRHESICYQAATFHQRHGHHRAMTDALEKLPNVEDRITFLQRIGFFDQAAELLLAEGKAQEAARLLKSKGKFLEAARLSEDNKFIGDCYLLAACSTVQNTKKEVRNRETEELINGLLERATEIYKRCNSVNGQAEVLFARGNFLKNSADVDEAAKLYHQASNYVALTECFLLLMDKDPKRISRRKALITLDGLLHLIRALHNQNREASERTAVLMCYANYGFEDIDDIQLIKLPHLEMKKFTNIENIPIKSIHNEVMLAKDRDKLIKVHIPRVARKFIEQVWKKHRQTIEKLTPCPRLAADHTCNITTCNYHHEEITMDNFNKRFDALLFLVHLEDKIADFLKQMKRATGKVMNELQQVLFISPEFTACEWLYELLFLQDGQQISSHFLSESNVSFLRRIASHRIIEFAKTHVWYGCKDKERWSSSDLFIEVSHLMHIAGAPARDIYNMLAIEEKKFEGRNHTDYPPGIFFDRRSGRCNIFSKSLERSKSKLYWKRDVLGCIHVAVKDFLFASAKKKALPYPSIANAVMILERQLTACLILYTRLMMNKTTVCLPESYLLMINFWDLVDQPQANQNITLYSVIQDTPQHTQGRDNFSRLIELIYFIVALTLGEINCNYNILFDAMCDNSVSCVDAERVLVLILTMLCNCGRGVPEKCEKLIREQILMLPLHQHLPRKLIKCVEDVRNATGFRDVVICLRELLAHKPQQERLCDVEWNEFTAKDTRINCKINKYSKRFYSQKIDIKASSENAGRGLREEQDGTEDGVNDNDTLMLNEYETHSQHPKYDDSAKARASLIIQRAYRNWKVRKEAKERFKEVINNDPVKCHFQSFKLDKSGCTICDSVQFDDRKSTIVDTISADLSSSLDQNEETTSTWQLRILQQNTFESHCSKGSPHWKKEKALTAFKDLYKKRIFPAIESATQLKEEMMKLSEETEVNCDLDLDRLNNTLSRLQRKIKKVEDERSWDSLYTIEKAAEEVDKETQKMSTKYRKGSISLFCIKFVVRPLIACSFK